MAAQAGTVPGPACSARAARRARQCRRCGALMPWVLSIAARHALWCAAGAHRGQVVAPRRLAKIELLPRGDGLPPRLHHVRIRPLFVHLHSQVARHGGHVLLTRGPRLLEYRLHVLGHLEHLPVHEAGLGGGGVGLGRGLLLALFRRGGHRRLWRRRRGARAQPLCLYGAGRDHV